MRRIAKQALRRAMTCLAVAVAARSPEAHAPAADEAAPPSRRLLIAAAIATAAGASR